MENLLYSQFLGPHAENSEVLKSLFNKVVDQHSAWRKQFYPEDTSLFPAAGVSSEVLEKELDSFLKQYSGMFPSFHPRYAAQMLKDPSLATILGYLAFMLANPNNHAYEGGPATTEMEMEVTRMMLAMAGFPEDGWGHLTSGGSLANLEVLWAVRDALPEGTVVFSSASHYSWKRICSILRIKDFVELPVDRAFRMDLHALRDLLKKKQVAFVMANLGSTGTGSVDDISELLQLKESYGFHLHIDAAYGGFARTLILDEKGNILPYRESMPVSGYTYQQLAALSQADSLTIDPHKLGAVSYGAGAVIYRDKTLRSVILNTAPYTYHLEDKPNIGTFSLEGSRPGAMAAACYLTYKVMPLHAEGLGSIIASSFSASRKLYELIDSSPLFSNLTQPDLDINCFYVNSDDHTAESVSRRSLEIYHRFSLEAGLSPEVILSKFVVPPKTAALLMPNPDQSYLSVLRMVMMKHWGAMDDFRYVRQMFSILEQAVKERS